MKPHFCPEQGTFFDTNHRYPHRHHSASAASNHVIHESILYIFEWLKLADLIGVHQVIGLVFPCVPSLPGPLGINVGFPNSAPVGGHGQQPTGTEQP